MLLYIILGILFIGITIYIWYFWRESCKLTSIRKFSKGYLPHLCPITDKYNEPKIIKNFVSKNLADKIIEWARPRLTNAGVLTPDEFDNKSRNNKITWMTKDNPLALSIIEKTEKLVKLPRKNFEDLQIAMYKPGMFYTYHTDQCEIYDEKIHDGKPCRKDYNKGGFRVYTLLLYLSDNFEGGYTDFDKLKKKYKVPKGDAILFENLNAQKTNPHPLSQHSGTKVTKGEKWICNFWIRQQEFFA